jgi:hypothetical protein
MVLSTPEPWAFSERREPTGSPKGPLSSKDAAETLTFFGGLQRLMDEAQSTRTADGGKRKAGPLWEGKVQKAPGLTIDRIVVPE